MRTALIFRDQNPWEYEWDKKFAVGKNGSFWPTVLGAKHLPLECETVFSGKKKDKEEAGFALGKRGQFDPLHICYSACTHALRAKHFELE